MKLLRRLFRFAVIASITASLYGVLVVGTRVTPSRWLRIRNRVFRTWARALSRTLGMRIVTLGEAPRPSLLVSNHLSYVDILLLAAHVDAVFVAKAEVAGWPVIGRLCRAVDTLFIDRESRRDVLRVGGEIERRVREGRTVIFFPEGTTGDGETLLPFRSSLLDVAARCGIEVHHAAIAYDSPGVAWHDASPFGQHVVALSAIPSFRAVVRFGASGITHHDRKALARALEDAVREDLEALSREVAPPLQIEAAP